MDFKNLKPGAPYRSLLEAIKTARDWTLYRNLSAVPLAGPNEIEEHLLQLLLVSTEHYDDNGSVRFLGYLRHAVADSFITPKLRLADPNNKESDLILPSQAEIATATQSSKTRIGHLALCR
jgi:hypothetical protein